MQKLVLFGAGKIGRSFIGQLFSRGGFEVVFVDIFKPVIDALNQRGSYNVVVKSTTSQIIKVENVRGVLATNQQQVIAEIASATIVGVSIGQQGLPAIMPLIAAGLQKRFEQNQLLPLDIIIAENLRDASEYFETELNKLLPQTYPIKQLVGLVETSIGKMVPIMLKKDMEEDILQVFAEPYNTLILDKKAFKNPIPTIEGLSPKENMKAWVDRKLFIHNLGHAATAYLGYLHNSNFVFLYEALAVPQLFQQVRETMLQAAHVLLKKYPSEFTIEALTQHIDDLLARFQNKALGDTIYRVGCDLTRKLSADNRLAGAIHLALELNMPFNLILTSLYSGCLFRATDENGKQHPNDLIVNELYSKGFENVLQQISDFSINQLTFIKKQHPHLF